MPDFAAALGQRIDGLRVGICRNHFLGNNQSDVDAAIEAAIRFYRDATPTMPATCPMVQ